MNKIIFLGLAIITVSAFAETQPTQPTKESVTPVQSTSTQKPSPPQDIKEQGSKESKTNIIDFCRTHTC
ncbi:MAG: hypothetical protein RLZZ66_745 [Pseudomonadota bacterium]|jgi:hypothetical protein